jgi:nicotinamidase/pyrazinamidase
MEVFSMDNIKVHPDKIGVLVVDVQNDFCPGGSLPVPDGDEVIPFINRLIDEFDSVVASKDYHPEESVHFEDWPKHCVKETEGAEFHPDLDTEQINKVFYKGTENADDGYSAFEATNDDLEEYLNDQGLVGVIVVGLATDYCVKNTAIEASELGFTTIVPLQGTKGVNMNEGDVESALNDMEDAGCIVNDFESIEAYRG